MLSRLVSPQRAQYLKVVGLMVRRELKVKYRGSVLGYLWSMLNPLLFMLIISFVFSRFVKGIPNYNVYVLTGILCWNLANGSIVGGTHSIVSNATLLRKIKMPIWVFALVPLSSGSVNFLLAMVPFVLIASVSGVVPGLGVLLFPLVLLLYVSFLAGIAFSLSTLNVFFRDVGHVLEPVLQLAFYATPIIYDRHNPAIPEFAARLLGLNPFTHFIEGARACLMGGELEVGMFVRMALAASLSLAVGLLIYKRAKRRIIFNI